jgi:hypothetical protein
MFPQAGGTQTSVLDRGFKNVRANGQITGFQVLVKSSYYRGIYVPLIDSIEVEVDGEKFAPAQIRCGFNGKDYEQSEFEKLDSVRWQWQEPATLTVRKPGGLKPGWHNVTITSRERISYMPTIPSVRRYSAKLALVR